MPETALKVQRNYGRWRRHVGSVGVWLVAVAALCWLFNQRLPRVEMVGIAQSEMRQVSSISTSRLAIMPVRLYEDVSAGQTVAFLNDDRVQAQLATAAAVVSQLRAELIAAEDQLIRQEELVKNDMFTSARRFAVDIESNRIRGLELTAILESDRIAFDGLRERLKLTERLVAKNVATPFELLMAQNEHDVLAKKIEENERILNQIELDFEKTQKRQAEFAFLKSDMTSIDKALDPLREQIVVQNRLISELSVDRAILVLASPIDGQVSQVLRRVGETVLAGDPILTIAAKEPSEIIAYVDENQVDRIHEGLEVTFFKRHQPQQVTVSNIQQVGPVVELMPERLWLSPTLPRWGRPVTIPFTGELAMIPGEIVGIHR